MRVLFLACIAISLISSAAAQPRSLPVRRGEPAQGFAATGILFNQDGRCTATVIPGTQCVITAAHCVYGYSGNVFLLEAKAIPISELDYPVNADGSIADISVAKLASPLVVKKEFKLPSADKHIKPASLLTVVGYGEFGGLEDSNIPVKRFGQMELLGSKSESRLEGVFETEVLKLAPGLSGQAICAGDSGGPVFQDDILVGINSAGVGYSNPGFRCVRETKRGLRFSRPIRTRKYKEQLGDFARLLGLSSRQLNAQSVARNFCEAINAYTAIESRIERELGLVRSSNYYLRLKRLAGAGKNWRLPTEAELKSAIKAKNLPNPESDLFWSGQENVAVDLSSGKSVELPQNFSSCDLEKRSEATSVARYREWIDRTISELGC